MIPHGYWRNSKKRGNVMTDQNISQKKKRRVTDYIPLPSLIIFAVGIVAAVLYVLFLISPDFSDFFNDTVSRWPRLILARITSVLPFSLGEYLVLALPVIIVMAIRFMFSYMDNHDHGFIRCLSGILSVAVVIFSIFVFDFAAGYRGNTLDVRMGIGTHEISLDELKTTADYVTEKLNSLSEQITVTKDGSRKGLTHDETVAKITEAYDKVAEEYSFITNFRAPVKRLAVSGVMTYTHISGVYTFYTGEANLNTNYPEFINVFTIAHEMAHQRGISRENEANFVAYLVCCASDDAYIQYSGYLNMFQYLISAIRQTSKETVQEIYNSVDDKIITELNAYSRFFDKYRESAASEVTEKINDTYLRSQGTEGTKSYGLVVDLAVAYTEQLLKIDK